MGRKKKWHAGKHVEMRFRIPVEKAEKYQTILKVKGRNMQQDMTDHIEAVTK